MLRNDFDRTRPYRVVAYLRMSSDKQNPRSPEQQLATIEETIRRLGLSWVVVATYSDRGISGRFNRKRLEFQRMLRDLRSGTVDAQLVLVDTFERLSRADDNAEIRRKLARIGVLVLTADSQFQDPTTTSGRALAMVESIRATEEGRVKAHNVLRGKRDAVRQGHWPGGPVPFGFRLRNVMVVKKGIEEVDHRTLEPTPELRWIVELIFGLADKNGWGGIRIARQCNAHPDINEDLKPFLPSTIDSMLNNELYYGEMVWGKNCTGIIDDVRVLQALPEEEWERNPDFCEPIISKATWERIQGIRAARGRTEERTDEIEAGTGEKIDGLRARGVALKFPLSGLVVCASCGRSMNASSGGKYTAVNGEERRYTAYACLGFYAGVCTYGRRIPEAWLRATVMNLIRERLFLAPTASQ